MKWLAVGLAVGVLVGCAQAPVNKAQATAELARCHIDDCGKNPNGGTQ